MTIAIKTFHEEEARSYCGFTYHINVLTRTKGYNMTKRSNQRGHNIKSREHRPER